MQVTELEDGSRYFYNSSEVSYRVYSLDRLIEFVVPPRGIAVFNSYIGPLWVEPISPVWVLQYKS